MSIDGLLDWYGRLAPANLDEIRRYYAPDCRFRDPIHRFQGADRLARLYAAMFANLEAPRFIIQRHAVGADALFIEWRFSARWRGRDVGFDGSSRLLLGADGRVTEHLDYWDAAEAVYYRLPLIGPLLRMLQGRLSRAARGLSEP